MKYLEALEALSRVLSPGRDKDSVGSPLAPSVVKKLDGAFLAVPSSTWRSMLLRARSMRDEKAAAMPSMGSKCILSEFSFSILSLC